MKERMCIAAIIEAKWSDIKKHNWWGFRKWIHTRGN
jgi:hypothetical protein